MSQTSSRTKLMKILECISACYQMEIIDSETKNQLIVLAKQGKRDNYDALYQFLLNLRDSDPLLDKIRYLL